MSGPIRKGDSRFNSRYIDEATAPLYPFGWGLTYTTFSYGIPKLDHYQIELATVQHAVDSGEDTEELIGVDVTLTNTGARSGTEVVQLYILNEGASVEQPVRELRGFERVALHPHETRLLHLSLSAHDLAFIGQNMEPVVEPTRYSVFVGGNATSGNVARFNVMAQ